ncbi:2-isopropylmalate synthase [Geodia barretti]|uniref:2-isopropylmalate synthase n=1 Tax=Geodia barretti TaxID=519541 RepID=A0AA35SL78_GEOBA|nr:2-isopropylmalate synthase [Geodia barretti]
MAAQVKFLDTTLRDGEQSAGIGMTVDEKLQIARQLSRLKVDIIEAGFAASSPGDFQAVQRIAEEVHGPIICSLSRAVAGDVDAAWGAIKNAEKPRIHVFLSSSEIHQMHQLRKDREDVMTMAVEMVSRAKGHCDDVEFSPDGRHPHQPRLPTMLRDIQQNVRGIENVTLSVHCHNDLGLAVSNSLAAIEVGARQVEGCINGIGERAGNASLEEIIMALDTRKDLFGVELNVDTTQIYASSRLVSRITGMNVQANKAIVGENAFRHASGIHQDGVLKNRSTYEVMQPERVGLPPDVQLVLGKLSGRAGLQARLDALGYSLDREEVTSVYQRFVELADKKNEVTDRDLEILMDEENRTASEPVTYALETVHFTGGDKDIPTATVRLIGPDGNAKTDASTGNGPVDAVCRAIDRVIGCTSRLADFQVQAVSEGLDSVGSVTMRIENSGRMFSGRSANTDIIVASAQAYLSAVNRMLASDEEMSLPEVGTTPD